MMIYPTKKRMQKNYKITTFQFEEETDLPQEGEIYYPPTELIVRPRRASRSYIRMANYSPGGPSFDAYIDDIPIGENLYYLERSPYIQVPPGEHTIRLFVPGDNSEVLYEETLYIPTRILLTIASKIIDNELVIQLINDSIRIPTNQSVVKFVNFSPDAPSLDLYINGDLYFEGVSEHEATDYITLPDEPEYTIQITDSETNELLIEGFNIVFEPNKSYTLYVVGLYEGDPPLSAVITLDGSSYLLDG